MADKNRRRSTWAVHTLSSTPLVASGVEIWQPPTDVYETDREIIIKVDIAGVEQDNLEVTIEGDVLHVHGYRTDCSAFSKLAVHRMEISCGEFATHVYLPHAVQTDIDIECTYHNGMLTVILLKETAHRVQIRPE